MNPDPIGGADRTRVDDLARIAAQAAVLPLRFFVSAPSDGAQAYFADDAVKQLFAFFDAKGSAALKLEDRAEGWYDDWIAYQAKHGLYAALLAPKGHSSLGGEFDLLRYSRFVEAIAYCSPAHGYSLQVSFLGLFAILMGANEPLKLEAVAALEAGGLFALAVSERDHGSDLLSTEFCVRENGDGSLVADGTKYYIGNGNAASMITILARKQDARVSGRIGRAPFVLFALRPNGSGSLKHVKKIRTLGVRAAFVADLEVADHTLPASDLIADGRRAWDAVFGTVSLGKFFLGFGSIGICEHAFDEAHRYLAQRKLYGKAVIEIEHIRTKVARAYARLAAMKLYAYRALDYVHAACADDRRYLLFTAVQKAKVSTEGVKVMALLSECIGAKGFESDTYFEMALRDVQLIPGLEGSTHINLATTAQFIAQYFARAKRDVPEAPSLVTGQARSRENAYLTQARTGAIGRIEFSIDIQAYQPLLAIANVRRFSRQVAAFRLFVLRRRTMRALLSNDETALALGQFLATIAYGQLVAEQATRLAVPRELVGAIFHQLVEDLSLAAFTLLGRSHLGAIDRALVRRLVTYPQASEEDWKFVLERAEVR